MPHRRSFEKRKLREELKKIYNTALLDRERAEIVALQPSRRLDIIRGEVLRSPRYTRIFWIER